MIGTRYGPMGPGSLSRVPKKNSAISGNTICLMPPLRPNSHEMACSRNVGWKLPLDATTATFRQQRIA